MPTELEIGEILTVMAMAFQIRWKVLWIQTETEKAIILIWILTMMELRIKLKVPLIPMVMVRAIGVI